MECSAAPTCFSFANSPHPWLTAVGCLTSLQWKTTCFVLQNSKLINGIWCLSQPPIHLDGRLQTTSLWLIFCALGAFFSDFCNVPLIFVPPSRGPQKVYSVIWQRKCFPAILFKCCLEELIKGSITSQDWSLAMALQVKDWHWLIPWQEASQIQLPFPVYKAILLPLYFERAIGLEQPWRQKQGRSVSTLRRFFFRVCWGRWHLQILGLRAMVLGLLSGRQREIAVSRCQGPMRRWGRADFSVRCYPENHCYFLWGQGTDPLPCPYRLQVLLSVRYYRVSASFCYGICPTVMQGFRNLCSCRLPSEGSVSCRSFLKQTAHPPAPATHQASAFLTQSSPRNQLLCQSV